MICEKCQGPMTLLFEKFDLARSRLSALEKERDAAIERAEKAEREVERLRGVCRGAYAARDIAEHDRDEMRKERDEARGQSYRAHGWKFNRAAREYAQGAEPSEPDEADVPRDVHESGWQWRPVNEDTAFAPPFGTVRACRVCGCLVAGGPAACTRCADEKQAYDNEATAEIVILQKVLEEVQAQSERVEQERDEAQAALNACAVGPWRDASERPEDGAYVLFEHVNGLMATRRVRPGETWNFLDNIKRWAVIRKDGE
jgi:hypothetical protein